MFHINHKRLLKEERENGVANLLYYEGVCMTCQNSADREARAACPSADFFTVTTYASKSANAKTTTHVCKNWVLASEFITCFKKNVNTGENPPKPFQNGFKERNKYK